MGGKRQTSAYDHSVLPDKTQIAVTLLNINNFTLPCKDGRLRRTATNQSHFPEGVEPGVSKPSQHLLAFKPFFQSVVCITTTFQHSRRQEQIQ